MPRVAPARRLLAASMAIVFGVFGADKFARPEVWIGWIPPWMENLAGLTRDQWLMIAGAVELLLAAGILFPVRIVRRIVVWLIVAHLLFVLTQTGINDIFVRDLGLLLAALALAMLL